MTRARLLLALAALIALLAAWHASAPPTALPADASATRFSAMRAMADVRLIGRNAHPVGSVEHGRVRARLVARMQALGLAPRVAAARAIKLKPGARGLAVDGAEVRNIVGVLPGYDSRLPAVLLMAHYDSVPSSPGAADDGAGLAAALETIRALKAGGPGRRDMILLFSDAEENGLLGARAFFDGDPAAARVGFVVNMDMRGGGGRAIMHETGRDAGGAIDLYRRTAIHPTTDSIAAWVERLIRNSSDFRVAVDRGLPGLNYAILDRQFDYHAASSTPERLDPRSLQHLGEQVLAVMRGLVDAAELPAAAPDPAYVSVLGLAVVAWPAWAGWLILGVGLAAGGIAWRRSASSAAGLRGVAAAAHLLLTLVLALMLARSATAIPFGFTVGRPLLAWWN
ncbi:M20/M25/M40 family metallo-hydrolase, partial [Sphingomonas solaris]